MLKAAGLLEDELDSLDNAVVSRYRFISAWLSGKEEYFDESDFENDVLNLYRTTKTEQGPHSLLVGPLVLHLLRHDYLTRSSIVEALTDIGFRASEVKSCLGSMHASDFFRYSGATSIENDEILVETDVLEAHWELLASAAYTDCMALVTPLPESIVGEDMSFSVYHKATHFETRTRTAFHFLEQIKADEIAVSTWRPNTERSKTSADVFSSRFRSLQIPSIYRLVSEPYLHRLHALRDKQMMRQDVNWSELLGDRLETIRKCPQTLTPLIVNK